jgi:hypothetical protein
VLQEEQTRLLSQGIWRSTRSVFPSRPSCPEEPQATNVLAAADRVK